MSYQVLTFITTNQSENPLYFSHAEQAAQRYIQSGGYLWQTQQSK